MCMSPEGWTPEKTRSMGGHGRRPTCGRRSPRTPSGRREIGVEAPGEGDGPEADVRVELLRPVVVVGDDEDESVAFGARLLDGVRDEGARVTAAARLGDGVDVFDPRRRTPVGAQLRDGDRVATLSDAETPFVPGPSFAELVLDELVDDARRRVEVLLDVPAPHQAHRLRPVERGHARGVHP